MPASDEPLIPSVEEGKNAWLTKQNKYGTKDYEAKFKLAFNTALWVSIFYIPVVWKTPHDFIFPSAAVKAGNATVLDLPTALGSPDLEGYWPNVVQFMFFTVYFSTGSTVKLAYQGICGTIVAGINQYWMGRMFPLGGKCLKQGPAHDGIRQFCTEFADPNFQKYLWLVWFDFFAVVFLLLSCNAQENVKKFGLSWHVAYMMLFMSPGGYEKSHAVNFTTLFGALLAIIVTLVPARVKGEGPFWTRWQFRNVVARKITEHPKFLADQIKDIIDAAVSLMLTAPREHTMIQRYQFKQKRFAIGQGIDKLPGLVSQLQDDYSISWWEGWLFAVQGNKTFNEFRNHRQHCDLLGTAFQDQVGGIDDVFYNLQKATDAEHLKIYAGLTPEERDVIKSERDQIKGPLKELATQTRDLLHATITNPEAELELGHIRSKITELRETYKSVEWNPGQTAACRALRSNTSVFIFSLISLANKSMDVYESVQKINTAEARDKEFLEHLQVDYKQVLAESWNTFFDTPVDAEKPRLFVVRVFTDPERRSFVLKNFLTISTVFVMGNFLEGNVFQPFNSQMAGTLAVLLSHFSGSAFYKNLMRLLGLTLGNALPIILMASVSVMGYSMSLGGEEASGSMISLIHSLVYFGYTFYFALMYYTSPEWAYVGCIVAGFGCYSFVGVNLAWTDSVFANGYKKIGQTTAAIFVQILIDGLDTWLNNDLPRDVAVKNLIKMCAESGDASIAAAYETFKSCADSNATDYTTVKTSVDKMKSLLTSQRTLHGECENKTVIVRGPRIPFKTELFSRSLTVLEKLVHELESLLLIADYSNNLEEEERGIQTSSAEYFHLQNSMRKSFAALTAIYQIEDESLYPMFEVELEVGTETAIIGTAEEEKPKVRNVRMDVAMRCVKDALDHAHELEYLCCASGAIKVGALALDE